MEPFFPTTRKREKALLLSKYCLDFFQYASPGDAAWEESRIESRLNYSFYFSSFSEEEKKTILLTALPLDGDSSDENEEPPAEHHLFLLSKEELEQYVPSAYWMPEFTPYVQALSNEADPSPQYIYCWLRWDSFDSYTDVIGYSLTYKTISLPELELFSNRYADGRNKTIPTRAGVRPALWVKVP